MGIQLLPSANALEVYQGVMKEMARLEKSFPPGLEWRLAFDNVGVVRESIKEVLVTLLEAIVLVILVMFLFLQNWRSTLIPAITIPVSLIGTFTFVKLFGFSINTLTLFGIVLATGIVVDDAIVVIENIERHMREEKKSSYQAAIDAMREVFGAVVVIGLVLVAVFVPVAFFPGTTGRLYQQFSLTIAFAVVLSVFNAVTFTPALSALLLAKETHAHGRFFTGREPRHRPRHERLRARSSSASLALRPLMLGLFGVGLLGDVVALQDGAVGLRARRGRGLLHHHHPGPGRARRCSTRPTSPSRRRPSSSRTPTSQAAFSVVGFSFSGARAQQRPDLHQAQGLRGAEGQGPLAAGGAQPGPRSDDGHPRRAGDPVRAARHPGPLRLRRLPVRAARPDGRRDLRPGRRRGRPVRPRPTRAARSSASSRASAPTTRSSWSDLDRDKARSLNLPAARGHGRAAGVPGLGLRERLRLQQPRLPRVRAGRPAVPRRPQGPAPALRPRHRRRDGAPRQRGARSARPSLPRSSATSTCSAPRRSTAPPPPA